MAPILAAAQPATPEFRGSWPADPKFGTMHLSTNLGSFKLIEGEGKVDFTFRGTVMVNEKKGLKISTSGNVRMELQRGNRRVYFGQGRIILDGAFRSVQWFGRDMRLTWYGRGVARITGEFDKDLNTGYFWYNNPNDKNYWFAGSALTIPVPQSQESLEVKPRERKE